MLDILQRGGKSLILSGRVDEVPVATPALVFVAESLGKTDRRARFRPCTHPAPERLG
jgi:hypothetical protein